MQKLTNTKTKSCKCIVFLFIAFFSLSISQHLRAESSGMLSVIDEATLLDTLVYMAVNDDASTLSSEIVEATGATYHDPYLGYYKQAVAEADTFVSIYGARVMFLQINTDQSLIEIQSMAANNDATNLQLWQLEDLNITGLNSVFHDNYKSAIADESAIENAEAIQVIIDGVNEQESLALIADMATNNDASLLSVLLLQNAGASPVVSIFLDDYKTAVEAEDTFNSTSEIIDMITGINNNLAFPRIQQMAVEDDASLLEYDLMLAAEANNLQDLYVPYYKEPIEKRNVISDLADLQHIVDSINPIAAWDLIQAMNHSGNVVDLNTAILIDAGATGVNTLFPQVLDIYKTGVYSADTIPDLATLQLVVDISNQWFDFVLWIIFQDASDLTIDKLELVGGEDLVAEYLTYYQYYLLKVDYNGFPSALQASVIEKGNILGSISDMAANNDALALTIEMLDYIEIPDVNPDYLPYYKDYIASAGSITNIYEIERIIDKANLFGEIADMAEANDASSLIINMLLNVGVENVVNENLAAYQEAIAAESSIGSLAELQAIIDAVNARIAGIYNLETLAGLKVYPVPASDYVTVDLENQLFSVNLIDAKGAVLYQQNDCNNKTIIPLNDIAKGMIILQVNTVSGRTSVSVVVE